MGNTREIESREASRSGLAVRIAIPVLGALGMGISGYLSYVHYRWVEPVCVPGMDCNSVLFSPYAVLWGVPISLLGFVLYACLVAGGLLLSYRRRQVLPALSLGVYTLALSGTLYSFFLTYREFFKLHALCVWCLGSALVITCLLVVSIVNLAVSGLRFTDIPRLINMRLTRRYSGNRSAL